MSALICGSVAYDTIMVFPDYFKRHILPDQIHILNVSFMVPKMRREFGGCAGNIAYSLKLLGGDPIPMATVGEDFGPYARQLKEHGITQQHVKWIADSFTAQAFITTDLDDNQITAFHSGAMEQSHQNNVRDVEGVDIGIVSPDGRAGMLHHAAQFSECGIPFIFDPGQAMPLYEKDDFLAFIDQADWVTVNDYECKLLCERTGLGVRQLATRVKAFIVTKGGEGSTVYVDNRELEIPAAKPKQIKDPTGCGDAYRAGLLYGLSMDMDWEVTARIASLIGALKIETRGTQNHSVSQAQFRQLFKQQFGFDMS